MVAKKLKTNTQPRNFFLGGAIGASVVDPNGSDYDAINAEKTARWAAEDAAKAAKYGIRSAVTPLADSPTGPAPNSLSSMAMQQPAGTAWQKDMDARQGRMTGYADKLRNMEAAGRSNSLMGSSSTITPSIGFAEGGKIDPEELMRQMNAKYGPPAAGPVQPAPVPQPAPTGPMTKAVGASQPAPQPVQPVQPQGIVGLLRNRAAQIDKAAGFAQGGKPRGLVAAAMGDPYGEEEAEGARIVGPGTSTSDSIPAVVGGTGEPIRVANGERIVSVAQDQFLERYARAKGFDSLDDFLHAGTGKPVGPTVRDGKYAAAFGYDTQQYQPSPELDALIKEEASRQAMASQKLAETRPYNSSRQASDATPVELSGGQQAGSFASVPAQSSGYTQVERRQQASAAPAPITAVAGNPNYGNEGRAARNDIMIPSTMGGNDDRSQQLLKVNTGADPDVTIRGAVSSRLPGSNTNVTQWSSGTDAAARSIDQRIPQQEGTGTMSARQPDGSYRNTVIDQSQYTTPDGSMTTDYNKSAQYQQGLRDAQNQRDQLSNMQRMRAETDAYDPSITDPHVASSARAYIAEQDSKAVKASEAETRALENRIKQTKLAADGTRASLEAQYMAETNPARKEALAETIRGVSGKGTAKQPALLQHVDTERGVMVFDPRTGSMTPATGPDGNPVPGSAKPLTEFQGKSTTFGMRAANSSGIIDKVGKNGDVQPSLLKRAAEAVPFAGESLGTMINRFQTPEQQQIEQAQRDFVNSVLRQESGAAISTGEFDNAKKQYFPQPGDSKEVIAQKKANRELAIKGFQISAGPAAKNIGGGLVQQAKQEQQGGPKVGSVEDGHVFLGGDPSNPASWKAVQ